MPSSPPASSAEAKTNMASMHPFLSRNQSVSSHGERQQALHSAASTMAPHPHRHKRRTKSFSSSDADHPPSAPSPAIFSPAADVNVDHALQELFHGKTKSKAASSFGGLLTGFFSCWKSSSTDAPMSASQRVAALLEISRKQQCELANKQDTIDMLEWQLEQMQVMEKQMEADSALFCEEGDEENRKPSDLNRMERKELKGDCHDQVKKVAVEDINTEKQQGEEKVSTIECGHVQEAVPRVDRRVATLSLFEMATVRARFSIRSFGKALIKQLEASGYSVLKTLMDLEPNVVFTRKEHVVYALESRINRAFYHSFENDNFDNTGLMQILNPISRCSVRLEEFQRLKLVEVSNAVNSSHPAFNEEFRRFCERKTRELWSQFSWSIAFNTSEERDVFTAAFLDAAKGVWLLHRLAFSLHPHVLILRVGKGLQIDPTYVEALPELVEGKPCPSCSQTKVEFLVVPGFHAMDKVIKCQVYQHIHC